VGGGIPNGAYSVVCNCSRTWPRFLAKES